METIIGYIVIVNMGITENFTMAKYCTILKYCLKTKSENLGKTVDMSLVYELVVGRGGAALVNAEEVLLSNIYELIQKGDKLKH